MARCSHCRNGHEVRGIIVVELNRGSRPVHSLRNLIGTTTKVPFPSRSSQSAKYVVRPHNVTYNIKSYA